jgi:hypothetical protein
METLKVTDELTKDAIRKIKEGVEIFVNKGQYNPLQPGFIKEVVLAQILEHDVVIDKHSGDGAKGDKMYEYLSCMIGAKNPTFAFDGMKTTNTEELDRSMKRISRNDGIYFGVFEGLDAIEVYYSDTKSIFDKVKTNLLNRVAKGSKNNEHTINISLKWVRDNCISIHSEFFEMVRK